MIIPELIIFHNINGILSFIKKDYEDATDKDKSIISRLFKKDDNGFELIMHRFNYKEQAIKLFVDNQGAEKSRRIECNVGYNLNRSGLPTIHITLPEEMPEGTGLGMGEGYQEQTLETEVDEDDNEFQNARTNYTAVYRSTYNIIITSDNSSEALLIYHMLKNLMFAGFQMFSLNGLHDIKFGGQDLRFESNIVPAEIFHRNLTISFFYESTVDSMIVSRLVSGMNFIGTPIDENVINESGD